MQFGKLYHNFMFALQQQQATLISNSAQSLLYKIYYYMYRISSSLSLPPSLPYSPIKTDLWKIQEGTTTNNLRYVRGLILFSVGRRGVCSLRQRNFAMYRMLRAVYWLRFLERKANDGEYNELDLQLDSRI